MKKIVVDFARNEITPEELKRLKEIVKTQKELRKTIQEAEDELGRIEEED